MPPQSVGGKPIILTCTECNNRHGSEIDVHVQRGRDLREIAEGKRPTWATLRLGENEITTKTTFGDKIEVVEVSGKSNPACSEALAREFEEFVTSNTTDWSVDVSYTSRHDPWREQVAWLRAAYLTVFALLGYNYILRSELNPIRDQFNQPDERIVPQIMKFMPTFDDETQILDVSQPADLRGFAVRLGKRLHFLPGFDHTHGFYDRLSALPAKGRLQVTGVPLPRPRQPMFVCDRAMTDA